MELIEYIRLRAQISDDLSVKIDSAFNREILSKGSLIFPQDSHCKKVFFFEKGFGRVYYLSNGKDITHYFFTEDTFSAPIESIFYNQATHCGMELLEKSTVRSANYFEIEKLISDSAPISKAIQIILLDVLRTFSDRLYAIQFQSALDRYNIMIESYPNIFHRSPLGHIASYLGITQETLSRIRSGKQP
jgi:CRP-like cAMP-binding protein